MAFDYTGKVVGITGAAGQAGIGFAIAKNFLNQALVYLFVTLISRHWKTPAKH